VKRRKYAVLGFNGISYPWVQTADPRAVPADPAWRDTILVSGRTVATIPCPAEAAVAFGYRARVDTCDSQLQLDPGDA
jgi:hypothetical protein